MQDYRETLYNKKTIVLKVGTSSLTFPSGRLNFERIEQLTKVIARLKDMGKSIVLVSSGSIGAGVGKLGLQERPKDLPGKQACASVGQAILMKIYRKLFGKCDINIAQILLTNDVITIEEKKIHARNTFAKLLEMGIVPIVNENDSVATDEIEIGDNDTLSAMVATLCDADLLILLSDIDSMFTADPRKDKNAKRISIVEKIDASIEAAAGTAGSALGTGGMVTKIAAAKICDKAGIDTLIANGDNPEIVFDIIKGKDIGTLFIANK